MSEDGQWPQPKPVPSELSAEQLAQLQSAKRHQLEEDQLARKLEHEEAVGPGRIIDTLCSKLASATRTAKSMLGTINRLEDCLRKANNRLAAKEESVKRQAQIILDLEKEVRELKATIDGLDEQLDAFKRLPNTIDSRKHTSAVKELCRLGYAYCGGEEWKPPLGQPPKHLLETDSATENAILALSELEDVLQRRGIDNKACLNALAYHFTERAKRRT